MHAPGDGRAEKSALEACPGETRWRERERDDRDGAGGKPVEPVGEVHGVAHRR